MNYKAIFFAAIVTGVLCAGTVSARQLQKTPGVVGVCSGRCSLTVPCASGCFCFVVKQRPITGVCVSEPVVKM